VSGGNDRIVRAREIAVDPRGRETERTVSLDPESPAGAIFAASPSVRAVTVETSDGGSRRWERVSARLVKRPDISG
jgi:hypothetical protein